MKGNLLDALFANRWALRLLSLAGAVLLWFFVAWDRNGEGSRSFRLAVEYQHVPEGLSLVGQTEQVDIRLAGSLPRLAELERGSLSALVDLKGMKTGVYRLPIRLVLPPGIRALSVKPERVRVELIRLIERRLPVFVDVKGDIPAGMKLELLKVDPPEVTLRGPEPEILRVLSAKIRPTLEQIRSGRALRLPVSLEGRSPGKIAVEMVPEEVLLVAAISRDFREAYLPVRVPVVGEPHEDYEVESVRVVPERVLVRGPARSVARMSELELESVDISGLRENTTLSLPLRSPLPETVLEGPSVARVEVRLKPRRTTKLYENVPIRIEGHSVYESWRVDPPSATVWVEGAPTATAPGPSGVPLDLYVDVTNVVSRKLVVPLLSRPHGEIRIVRIDPPQVLIRAGEP